MSDGQPGPAAIAEKRGLRLVLPAPNELFLDIDSWAALSEMNRRLPLLAETDYTVRKVTTAPSKTAGHHHVVITLAEPVDVKERVFLQAILGSDPTRELLALQAIADDRPDDASVFFEQP